MEKILSGFQDLVISIGTEVLKENGTKKYNKQMICNELKEYVHREYKIYEGVDKNSEIDFEVLQNYINENLLDDFKKCLIGGGDTRSKVRKHIIEKLYAYTNANTDEKKKYVERIFHEAFNIIKYFYETKFVEEESLFLVNKAVDEIDERFVFHFEEAKKEMKEQRHIEYIYEEKVRVVTLPNMDPNHKIVMEKFIKRRFGEVYIDYDKYSDLFKMCIQITDNSGNEIETENLFAFIKEKINDSNEDFVKILGPDGTGKSTFLSILYLYLYNSYINSEISFYPFYINLHYYDKIAMNKNNQLNNFNEIKNMMLHDMKNLINLSKENKSGVLIIIDGNESYFRTTLRTGRALREVLESFGDHKKIICIGEKTNVHTYRRRTEVMYINSQTSSYVFNFNTVYVDNKQRYKDFITKFYGIQSDNTDVKNILKHVEKFKLREIDLNFLTVLDKCNPYLDLDNIFSLSDLYRKYCVLYFEDEDERIEYCSELAYKYFMTREKIEQKTITEKWGEWELIHQHKTISNYLLAVYYGNLILNYDNRNLNQLECILSNGINVFLKSIINENSDTQRITLNNCIKIYEEGNYLAKAQSAYILGRIESIELREEIIRYLYPKYRELFEEVKRNRHINKNTMFLFRTISISLLMLGNNVDVGRNLLEKLLSNSSLNEINRAFFLQYYDDIKFEPEQVNFQDTGSEDMIVTFYVLYNQIKYLLKKDKRYWRSHEQYSFQINLFTLCSLVQVRLNKNLAEGYIVRVKKIIDAVLVSESISLNRNLKMYLLMLQQDIENKTYDIFHLYKKLYEAKDVIRSGWKDKIESGSVTVDRYENIIEHTYYTWLLGMLYLPEQIQTNDETYRYYNKNKILDCILIHDLAETYVGDKRPEENTDEHKLKEDECMQKIFMHDTYNDIYCMDKYRKIWNRFGLESRDINGKIAKELDIIQSIYQYYSYKQQGAIFESKKDREWKNEKRRIETSIGRKILEEVVLKTFEK